MKNQFNDHNLESIALEMFVIISILCMIFGGQVVEFWVFFKIVWKKKIIQLTKVAAVILLFPTFYLILRCCLCNVISQHIVGKEAAVNGTLLIELFWSSRGWEICLSFLYLECQSLDNQYIFSVSLNSC